MSHEKGESNRAALSVKPSVWYFRQAVRELQEVGAERGVEGLSLLALAMADEVEELKAQLREVGEIPRRVYDPRRVFAAVVNAPPRQLSGADPCCSAIKRVI